MYFDLSQAEKSLISKNFEDDRVRLKAIPCSKVLQGVKTFWKC